MKLNATAIALCFVCAAHAQSGPSAANEAKQAYNRVKSVLTKAAEKIPDADYSFKATPDVRTIATLIGHIADVQSRMCAGLTGSQPAASASSKTAKADLVAALQESFSACDKAVDSLTDANALEAVGSGRMQRTRIGAIYGMLIHSNEEYGYLAVYMRLKGIVPPSSESR
jgi:DinB superfamily